MSWPAQQAPFFFCTVSGIELQRDADHVIALALEQRRGDGGIHAARHGDDDAGGLAGRMAGQ